MMHPAAAEHLLDQAQSLRDQLAQDRADVRQQLTRCGRVDPLERVTGISAFDQAIDEIELLIRKLEVRHVRSKHRSHEPALIEVKPASVLRLNGASSQRASAAASS